MQLSEHFALAEFTRSQTAIQRGIPNRPNKAAIANLKALTEVMEDVRTLLECPLRITSGYRGPRLNRAIGGGRRSQHLIGQACDFQPIMPGMHTYAGKMKAVSDAVAKMRKYLPDSFDQVILEPGWIHLSYRPDKRKNWLRAKRIGGRMRYFAYDK